MKLTVKSVLYLVITILIVSFIFYNSMQNGESSSNASTAVLNLINDLINSIGINFQFSGYFIRKLAHFVEFFSLGFFLMLMFEAFTGKIFSIIGFPMFFTIFVPVIDEYIQIYSPGRTSSIKDVLLDFSGAIIGIIVICIYLTIKKKYKLKNKYKLKY